MLIDTHTHLYIGDIQTNTDQVVQDFVDAGGKHMIHVSVDLPSSNICLGLARKYINSSCAVGIHPTSAHDMNENQIDDDLHILDSLIQNNRDTIVAVGEIGRDHHWLDKDPQTAERQLELQEYAFFAQVRLAKKYDLPVIIHTRDCSSETLEMIKTSGVQKFVIHCFSEDAEFAKAVIETSQEAMISFTCNISYPQNDMIRNSASYIPLDRIMIETDTPFLLPVELKSEGGYNHPANVVHVLKQIQTIRDEPADQVERDIYLNSLRFFSIDIS